jgi:hypothetical protein
MLYYFGQPMSRSMNAPASLTPKQQDFVARACAFIDSGPPPEEIDKLLTLAALQLPDSVVEMLRRRARTRPEGDDTRATRLH